MNYGYKSVTNNGKKKLIRHTLYFTSGCLTFILIFCCTQWNCPSSSFWDPSKPTYFSYQRLFILEVRKGKPIICCFFASLSLKSCYLSLSCHKKLLSVSHNKMLKVQGHHHHLTWMGEKCKGNLLNRATNWVVAVRTLCLW